MVPIESLYSAWLMKSSLLSLLLFTFLSLFFEACSSGPEEEAKKEEVGPTVVEGSIGTHSEGELLLKKRKGLFTYEDSTVGKSDLEKGKFHISFDLKGAGYLALEDPTGGLLLYLRPGDSLVVRKGLEGPYRFEGSGAPANEYIQKKRRFRDSLGRKNDSLFEVEKEEFEKAFKERKQAYRSFHEMYANEADMDHGERFKELERLRDRIELAILKFSYPDIYLYENPNDTVSFPQEHWDFLDSMDLNDPMFLHVPDYLSFAYDVANKYTLDNKGEQRNMSYREMLFRTIQEEFEGEVEEALLTYFILEQTKYAPERVMDSFLERYRKVVDDPRKRAFVERKLKELKEKEAL